MDETSTVTFIAEVEVKNHESDLSDEKVAARAFELFGEEWEHVYIIDVKVDRERDED